MAQLTRQLVHATAVVAVLAASCVAGLILDADDIEIPSLHAVSWGSSVFAKGDVAGSRSPRVGVDVTLVPAAERTGSLSVAIIPEMSMHLLGIQRPDGSVSLCCTQQLYDTSRCGSSSVGQVIVHEVQDGQPRVEHLHLAGMSAPTPASIGLDVTHSGVHHVMMVNCDDIVAVSVHGEISWLNPYGYLPAAFYAYLPFYGSMSFAYLLVAAVWLGLSARNWKDLIQLQFQISGVMVLGVVEMTIAYGFWADFNATGRQSTGLFYTFVVLETMKMAISRILVLVVSMGYGVMRASLGSEARRIAALATAYFILLVAWKVITETREPGPYNLGHFVLATIVALLETCFIAWILISLSRSIAVLQERRQTIKLERFKAFRNIMGGVVITACVFSLVDLVTYRTATWRTAWVPVAFWHLWYLVVLIVVSVLWRPSKNSAAYQYNPLVDAPAADDVEMQDSAFSSAVTSSHRDNGLTARVATPSPGSHGTSHRTVGAGGHISSDSGSEASLPQQEPPGNDDVLDVVSEGVPSSAKQE